MSLSRNRVILAALAAAIVIVAAAYLLLRDDKHPAKRAGLPTVSPQLDTGGLALASLLRAGRTETYHARYTSTADPTVSGGTVALEAWNTSGKSRTDTTFTTKDRKTVHTASILVSGKAVACQQPPGAKWTCKKVDAPAEGDPAGLVASLTAKLSGRSVTEHAEKVGGEDARCFHISAAAAADAVDACVNSRGILLRVASTDAKFEIAKLDKSVPTEIFTAPAAPEG